MKTSDMKNMVVLKNIPSNMVEEAIIIFKETQKVRQRELIDKNNEVKLDEQQTKSKEYIVKEAEDLIEDYINKIENSKKTDINNRNFKNKYYKLRTYSIISTICLLVSIVINFI